MKPIQEIAHPEIMTVPCYFSASEMANVPDVTKLEGLTEQDLASFQERGAAGLLHVPVRYKDTFLGVIRAATQKPQDWDEDIVLLIDSFANQIAIAIYQARMLRDVQQSERKFRAIFDNVLHLISIHDTSGRFVDINPAGEDFFGLPRDQIIGKTVQEILAVTGTVQEGPEQNNWEDLEHEGIWQGEFFSLKPTGERVALSYNVIANIMPGRHLAILNDITQQKHVQEMLQQYADLLKRSNVELESFATIASHDLRTPLRKIGMFIEQFQRLDNQTISEEGKALLERTTNAVQKMQHLIDDLLALSRISRKGEPFQEVDLDSLLQELLQDMDIEIQNVQGQVIVTKMPTVEADPGQMRQLFQNLIGNALKFHRAGVAPVIRVEAEAL